MLAAIDGDIVAYRVGFSCQKQGVLVEPVEVAYARVDELMGRILHETSADEYVAYLSGGTNYRLQYNPEYKANRDPSAKPILLPEIRQYLLDVWKAEVTDGIEADDALGILQCQGGDTVICSIDKDLHQIPGNHYNFVRQEWTTVSEWDGLKFFYKQMLIGDTIDNIFGVFGIGPKKASQIIDPCISEREMYEQVQFLYDTEERLVMNAHCLYIQKKPNDRWEVPPGEEETTDESGAGEESRTLQESA